MVSEPEGTNWLRLPFDTIYRYVSIAYRRYTNLHFRGKLLLCLFASFYIAVGIFILVVGLSTVAQYLYDVAQRLSHLRFGWLVLGAAIAICFPPCVGHTTIVSLCGFAYGMNGFFLAAIASWIGSGLAFIILRLLFAKRLQKWTSTNDKWIALDTVIKDKGLLLIILIRMSPIPPWVYSTSLFASIQSVKLWQFLIATTFVFPKLLLNVFIGYRLASLSDGGQRAEMDTQTKVLNSCLVAGSILIGIVASITVYRLVQGQLRSLKGIPEIDASPAEALDEADQGLPLLGNYSSESIDALPPPRIDDLESEG